MGVRISELPETTGINKEDLLIVEDGQGTKQGTIQQLDEALEVSKIKEDLNDYKNGFEYMPIVAGEYVGTDGVFNTDSNWSRTEYIGCSLYKKLRFIGNTKRTICNAFYDSSKTFIKKFAIDIGECVIDVPSNAKYFVISNTSNEISDIKLINYINFTIKEFPETTGINKEDLLVVEDGQGTKKGTVQQLDDSLGVSRLREEFEALGLSVDEEGYIVQEVQE